MQKRKGEKEIKPSINSQYLIISDIFISKERYKYMWNWFISFVVI